MGVLGGQLYVLGGYNAEKSVERLLEDGSAWEEVEGGLQGDFYYGGAIFVNKQIKQELNVYNLHAV